MPCRSFHRLGGPCTNLLLVVALLAVALLSVAVAALEKQEHHPQLSGYRFRVTVVQGASFLAIAEPQPNDDNDEVKATGYVMDLFKALADRANFSYDLVTPSGFGDDCVPQFSNVTTTTTIDNNGEEVAALPYGIQYYQQHHCGTNDVNQMQGTNHASDMYLGMFYITPSVKCSTISPCHSNHPSPGHPP